MGSYSWTCPFCNRDILVSETNTKVFNAALSIENKHGPLMLLTKFITCPNEKCREVSITANLYKATYFVQSDTYRPEGAPLKTWQLLPSSTYKNYPDYIPAAIIADYIEACEIVKLSPKASATLSRRCLQGMIRDFWKVREKNLYEEINQIKNKVDPLIWSAIDAVRSVGNIGAHMEKDINIIIDVEPEEAALLISLIEDLLKDWYITRHEREQKYNEIIAIKDRVKLSRTEQ